MEKYATYRVYYCKETKEYIRIPHSNIDEALKKYAAEGLLFEEIVDEYEPDKMRIVQPQ